MEIRADRNDALLAALLPEPERRVRVNGAGIPASSSVCAPGTEVRAPEIVPAGRSPSRPAACP